MSAADTAPVRPTTPQEAWDALVSGNLRFAAGAPAAPRRDLATRAALAGGQAPFAVVLGCGDSRAPIEVLFDQGLGDVFVIRNAGQVASESALAGIEFAIEALGVSLVVVLAHSGCGAVAGTIAAEAGAATGPLTARGIVAAVAPALDEARTAGDTAPAAVGRIHLQRTVAAVTGASPVISDALAAGTVQIVGARYDLETGLVEALETVDGTGRHRLDA